MPSRPRLSGRPMKRRIRREWPLLVVHELSEGRLHLFLGHARVYLSGVCPHLLHEILVGLRGEVNRVVPLGTIDRAHGTLLPGSGPGSGPATLTLGARGRMRHPVPPPSGSAPASVVTLPV